MLSVTHEFHRLKRTHTTNTRRCWTEMCFKQKRHSLTQSDGSKEKNKKDKRPKTAKAEDQSTGQYPYTSTCFELFIFTEQ